MAERKQKELRRSKELLAEALTMMPWGTQTMAKIPNPLLADYQPAFIQRAKGCRVWDVDGNEYIDFRSAMGPAILGYADDDVDRAVKKEIDEGNVFGMAHPIEIELAKLMCEVVPCAERVRFLKTGNGATSAIVRIARAYTGREKVISSGYHGWSDWSFARHKMPGIPKAYHELIIDVPPDNIEALKEAVRKHKKEVAVVIVDLRSSEWMAEEFAKAARQVTAENGLLLGFDEVVTGFRYSLGGAQERYGTIPELAAFSKAMANGYSISAVCGRADIMEDAFAKTKITGTFFGAKVGIAAAIATIHKLREKNVPAVIWERGKKFMAEVERLARANGSDLRCSGVPCCFRMDSKDILTLEKKLYRNCVFPSMFWYLNYCHTDDVIDEALGIMEKVLGEMKRER